MMFTTSHPAFRRNVYAPAGRALERFLSNATIDPSRSAPQYKQDETAFHLSLDIPGISRDQLTLAIEGPVVRISSRDGAPRQYRVAYELPQDIEPTLSEAKLENGVLTLKLTKKIPVSNAAEITIQ